MNAALRARCDLDLGFPFHTDGSPADRLERVAAYMRSAGLSAEAYLTGESVARLEARMASLFGKPAAVWFPSGTMAQGVAARLHCKAAGNARLGLHPTSHLALHEEDGHIHLHGLEPVSCGAWPRPLSADDLPAGAGCTIIELPQRHNGGAVPGWDTLQAIKARARETGQALHMDGNQIGEAGCAAVVTALEAGAMPAISRIVLYENPVEGLVLEAVRAARPGLSMEDEEEDDE